MVKSDEAASTTSSSAAMWKIIPHVHADCLGRLLTRTDDAGCAITRCADCGAEAQASHEALCCCGALLTSSKVKLRCVRNDLVTPESPAEIIVVEEPQGSGASSAVGAVHGTAGAPW
jgi:hypothetical protein